MQPRQKPLDSPTQYHIPQKSHKSQISQESAEQGILNKGGGLRATGHAACAIFHTRRVGNVGPLRLAIGSYVGNRTD